MKVNWKFSEDQQKYIETFQEKSEREKIRVLIWEVL